MKINSLSEDDNIYIYMYIYICSNKLSLMLDCSRLDTALRALIHLYLFNGISSP